MKLAVVAGVVRSSPCVEIELPGGPTTEILATSTPRWKICTRPPWQTTSTVAIASGAAEAAFRFAPGTAIYGGTTDVHRNMVAEQVLGLPRSTPRG